MGKTRARSIFVALLFSSGRLPDEAEGAFLNDFLRRIKKTWSYSPMESSLNRSLHPRHPPGVTRKGEKGFQPIQRVALELPSDDHRLSAPSLATLPFSTVEANFLSSTSTNHPALDCFTRPCRFRSRLARRLRLNLLPRFVIEPTVPSSPPRMSPK
jgi:hypothetical protein